MTKEQDAIFSFIFRTTADGIVILDADRTIQRINPAMAAMFRLTPDECVGKKPSQVFKSHGLVNLLMGHGERHGEIRLPKQRVAVGFGDDLPGGGRIVLVHDVTEQQMLESRREALGKAIAHDLRNPVAAIEGFAELVRMSGQLNDAQQRFLTRITETASKLGNILRPLVDLAWIEAGMPMQHQPCYISRLIREAVSELADMAQEKEITIAISVQEPMPPVMGDPDRLRRVIYNLIHNAITYSPSGITVAVHAWEDGQQVYCSVADPGPGIRPDEAPMVFDRMFRSKDENVRKKRGAGLGLTFARTVIQRHGGDIWVESEYGEGSTFTFTLPLAKGAEED